MAVALVLVAGLQERAAVASLKEGSKLVPTLLVVTCTVLVSCPARHVVLLLFAVLPPMVLLRVAAVLWPSIGALQVALVWPFVTQ
jgi:hypothetical protein